MLPGEPPRNPYVWAVLLTLCLARGVASFAPNRGGDVALATFVRSHPRPFATTIKCPPSTTLFMADSAPSEVTLVKIPEDDDTPIAFVDTFGSSFIECYADSVVTLEGQTYTIGSPCDCSVALTYFDESGQLFPVELDSELMDDVFPVAETIVEEEFGEELVLQRTPQTLTLVGELEEEEDEEELDNDDDADVMDDEEEVEILLSFEHKEKEFHLVRLLDPVLLVGKSDPSNPERRLLLSPEDSDKVMPLLEEMFLKHQEESDGISF
uniref:Uncharacterized protein n=1 Tax=Pseudictyota dubia TaxID=2749911 RepID=A0A7R9ZCD2_9STRA|mmetsp:Transcript_37313/g.69041  ORF Transcript_37313/g.69041 Transcript_37313/m.69041 type:complete len:267 (+) Transcript_37313:3-803(+)